MGGGASQRAASTDSKCGGTEERWGQLPCREPRGADDTQMASAAARGSRGREAAAARRDGVRAPGGARGGVTIPAWRWAATGVIPGFDRRVGRCNVAIEGFVSSIHWFYHETQMSSLTQHATCHVDIVPSHGAPAWVRARAPAPPRRRRSARTCAARVVADLRDARRRCWCSCGAPLPPARSCSSAAAVAVVAPSPAL